MIREADDVGVPVFGVAQARDWARGLVPWWAAAAVLSIGWVAATVISIVFDTAGCSAADPSVCGPDLGFSTAAVALFATPILLWWIPRLGCLAGMVFGVLDARLDAVAQAPGLLGLLRGDQRPARAVRHWRALRPGADQPAALGLDRAGGGRGADVRRRLARLAVTVASPVTSRRFPAELRSHPAGIRYALFALDRMVG